ncbi:MAG: hypothetical protein A2725_00290 [Candidatus Magasanikbacteria bacterium RIFCSPHIGHO2_01_FULL_33_34]|uniref:Exonuclease domain-containing protein n=1 Tax=Candidatus Magasanikbacteria bacterium RIFCSPHIGHO2_01_FULL_33_34 TaxID=1798671 RepID=A0A1F6LL81_9BACT|nr:MAG: hypothetical protein A2725_00290 [Candidatus Magasanikbacteria bacterium RIFCSPHIGHO2_01_FULL_33_34]OGH65800.1 MAG: hypothetical protein A3B83_02960 [Candidatus Magasanikbacteria bacterium RIFCSPHIGHO2_02_FULL_33_17]OGH75165.1 MAG: hypothetical protein A3A89_03555 [Candidatus Magasanikbacteria bacterium RIFCSPLOWO2_01_FULL_33_34]OGH81554.1 MAG: hypothetical protein A3F93_00620 [Candidatus Magasanikbacteria bacterium RIFCSPLOWO2_12_FULL_34_7]
MMLKIIKPIVFFDLEATGLNVFEDRIIQIGAIKYFPDGSKTEHEWLINPKIPITDEAMEIHGITNEMVKDKPTFGDIAQDLTQLFLDSDLGGYNIRYFDIPMLQNEFSRIELPFDVEDRKIVDAMLIFKLKEPRTLAAAYKKYVGGEFENAHNAIADIKASIDVLEGQMKMYNDLPTSVDEIHTFCFPEDPDKYDMEGKLRYIDGELTINFGKNRGRSLKELAQKEKSYLLWILNGSFSEKVKEAIQKILK